MEMLPSRRVRLRVLLWLGLGYLAICRAPAGGLAKNLRTILRRD